MSNKEQLAAELRRSRRARLTERLRVLRDRARMIETELLSYTRDHYRVCIFGSARIKPDDEIYKSTFKLAEGLGTLGIDVLTGGGPGLMEAANKGVIAGKKRSGSKSKSFGLTIDLNIFEPHGEHLDIKQHHRRFSSRLDDFMNLSNAVVVERGGIGTLLELYFTWQLVQVGHMPKRPIILMDRAFWNGLICWMKDEQLGRGLLSGWDFDWIHMVDKPEAALDIIRKDHKKFLKEKKLRKEQAQNPSPALDEENKKE